MAETILVGALERKFWDAMCQRLERRLSGKIWCWSPPATFLEATMVEGLMRSRNHL